MKYVLLVVLLPSPLIEHRPKKFSGVLTLQFAQGN